MFPQTVYWLRVASVPGSSGSIISFCCGFSVKNPQNFSQKRVCRRCSCFSGKMLVCPLTTGIGRLNTHKKAALCFFCLLRPVENPNLGADEHFFSRLCYKPRKYVIQNKSTQPAGAGGSRNNISSIFQALEDRY